MALTYLGFGQASATNSKNTTSVNATITLNFTPAVNDCIVVMCTGDTGVPGVSGGGVSTWTSTSGSYFNNGSSGYTNINYGYVTTAGTTTITIAGGASGAYTVAGLAIGFSGLDPNGTTAHATTAGSGVTLSTGTMTTALQGVVISTAAWGSTATLSNALTSTSPASGYTDPFTGGAQRVTTAGSSRNGALSLGITGAWYNASSNAASTAFNTTSTISGSAIWAGEILLLPIPPTQAPQTAPTLSVTTTNGGANLSWNSISLASSYKVYRNGALLKTVTTTSTSDSGLTNGQQYSYYVVPNNPVGDGPASNTVTITATVTVTLYSGGPGGWYAYARTANTMAFSGSVGSVSMAANSVGVLCVGFDSATATVTSITSSSGATWTLLAGTRIHGNANSVEMWITTFATAVSEAPTVNLSATVNGIAYIANFVNASNGWESPVTAAQNLGAQPNSTQTLTPTLTISNNGAMEISCVANVWDATNSAYAYIAGSNNWGSQPAYDSALTPQGSVGAGHRAVDTTYTTSNPGFLSISGTTGTSQFNYAYASAVIVGTQPVGGGGGGPTPTEGGSGLRVISKMR